MWRDSCGARLACGRANHLNNSPGASMLRLFWGRRRRIGIRLAGLLGLFFIMTHGDSGTGRKPCGANRVMRHGTLCGSLRCSCWRERRWIPSDSRDYYRTERWPGYSRKGIVSSDSAGARGRAGEGELDRVILLLDEAAGAEFAVRVKTARERFWNFARG